MACVWSAPTTVTAVQCLAVVNI